MKCLFAAALVVIALVAVFDVHKLVPIPRAMGSVVGGSLSKHLPFGLQRAYMESCMANMSRERDQVRYALSDTSVRLRSLDSRIEDLKRQQNVCRAMIHDLVSRGEGGDSTALSRAVKRHDHIQSEIYRTTELRNRLADTAFSLELAENRVSTGIRKLDDRLDMVALDHERNNARELDSQLADVSYPGRFSRARQCAELLDKLEHRERIREDMLDRYGPESLNSLQTPNPAERAREILAEDC